MSDCDAETLAKLKARYPSIETVPPSEAAAQDLVVLSVNLAVMAEVVAGIKDNLKPGMVVVSLAPKFTTRKLTELLGGFARVASVIPNAPSLIGAGFNPVSFALAMSDSD